MFINDKNADREATDTTPQVKNTNCFVEIPNEQKIRSAPDIFTTSNGLNKTATIKTQANNK